MSDEQTVARAARPRCGGPARCRRDGGHADHAVQPERRRARDRWTGGKLDTRRRLTARRPATGGGTSGSGMHPLTWDRAPAGNPWTRDWRSAGDPAAYWSCQAKLSALRFRRTCRCWSTPARSITTLRAEHGTSMPTCGRPRWAAPHASSMSRPWSTMRAPAGCGWRRSRPVISRWLCPILGSDPAAAGPARR